MHTTRLPWPANEGIRWRKTDIRDLWPPSLVELFENDEMVQKSPTEVKRTRCTRGDGGAEKEETAGERAVNTRRQEGGGQKSRRTDLQEPRRQEPQRTSGLPGARGPWTQCRHGVGHPTPHRTPQNPSRESPIDGDEDQDGRWVPRHGERPVGGQSLPDQLEGVDDSKDDQRVSRRGGQGPEPLRVSEPSTWQRCPVVQPTAPVNDECPRERAVESRVRSERGQQWVDEISMGLRPSGSWRDLLHRCIQGGTVGRDLGMVDVDGQFIAALQRGTTICLNCVLLCS